MERIGGECGAVEGVPGAVVIDAGGESVWLLPQRGVYWPAGRTLLVADLHLGKADAARAEGAPVGPAVLAAMVHAHLGRLGGAVRAVEARRVIVLGDLLHAPAGTTPALVESVGVWAAALGVPVDVVPGNHDRALGKVAGAMGVGVLGTCERLGPFVLAHDPAELAGGGGFGWCGHLHPAASLSRGGDAVRLPAFWMRAGVGVLPAFTSMAAGRMPALGDGERLYAVAGGAVVDVTPPGRAGGRMDRYTSIH